MEGKPAAGTYITGVEVESKSSPSQEEEEKAPAGKQRPAPRCENLGFYKYYRAQDLLKLQDFESMYKVLFAPSSL